MMLTAPGRPAADALDCDVPSATPAERVERLMQDHRVALLAQAMRLTSGDWAWSEDVVQETFIRAWRNIDRMTDDYGSVRGWLSRVTHNLVMDGHRSHRDSPTDLDKDYLGFDTEHDISDGVLNAVLVQDVLATLGPHHRDALEQTFLRDRTVVDAARRLGLPVGTVKSRVFYALRQLREATPRTLTVTDVA